MDYKQDVAKSEAQAFPLFNQLLKDAVSFCADINGKKHNSDLELLGAHYIQIFPLSNFLTIYFHSSKQLTMSLARKSLFL